MIWLLPNQPFPAVEEADELGRLAIEAKLTKKRVLEAYPKGIFPWYNEDEPVIWWSPNPRMVLYPKDLIISKSMQKILDKNAFQFTVNQYFTEVLDACGNISRPNQEGTWISDEIKSIYTEIHQMGIAKSVEIWQNKQLVGGLYGIEINQVFCGESMFSKVPNASKAGLIWMIQNSNYKLIDCQVYTSHLASLGAKLIPRKEFLKILQNKD